MYQVHSQKTFRLKESMTEILSVVVGGQQCHHGSYQQQLCRARVREATTRRDSSGQGS